jgi:hypothetical protein
LVMVVVGADIAHAGELGGELDRGAEVEGESESHRGGYPKAPIEAAEVAMDSDGVGGRKSLSAVRR